MSTETLVKCSHAPCQCLVEAEQPFCSATCASARGLAGGPCMCGHAGCAGERELELSEEEVLDSMAEDDNPDSRRIE